jgi:hypothetical protein
MSYIMHKVQDYNNSAHPVTKVQKAVGLHHISDLIWKHKYLSTRESEVASHKIVKRAALLFTNPSIHLAKNLPISF